MVCPKCKKENMPNAAKCNFCGAELPSTAADVYERLGVSKEAGNLKLYSRVFNVLSVIILIVTVIGGFALVLGILEIVPYIFYVIGAAVSALFLSARSHLFAGMAELLEKSTK